MKTAYWQVFAIFIFVVSCSPNNSSRTYAEKYPLQLRLSLDKETYDASEPILLKLIITNIGEEDVLAKSRLELNFFGAPTPEWDVAFIFGTKGETEPGWALRKHLADLRDDDFTILQAGSSIEEVYDLREYYIFDKGEYTVSALYQSSEDAPDGRNPWRGVVPSNSGEFRIKP